MKLLIKYDFVLIDDPFFKKVVMLDGRYFYVPASYNRFSIYRIIVRHKYGYMKIRFEKKYFKRS